MATLRYRAKFIKTHTDGKASGALEKGGGKSLPMFWRNSRKRCFCEQRRLEKFISEVKSSEMRIIFGLPLHKRAVVATGCVQRGRARRKLRPQKNTTRILKNAREFGRKNCNLKIYTVRLRTRKGCLKSTIIYTR
ncbi:MAG: hypothetical protein L6V93_17440 [Clostridiales bacterium]|nr:MAG: hypothetical protein L6V93_17440 [Clostridiales bacterium]